jgi:glucosylceramidase
VQVVETTGDRTMLLQPQPSITFGTGGSSTGLVISVDDSIQYQQMDGFGASLTDSAARVVANKLSAAQLNSLWQSLCSPSAGIGISFLRQPMRATDFSASGNYSYDDVPAGQTDPSLANFSIAHDTAYITPLLQQALTTNPTLKIVAVPWSPPAWKTSGTMNGGNMNTAYFPSLAQYFVKFVQDYQQQGISIYAVVPRNRICRRRTE